MKVVALLSALFCISSSTSAGNSAGLGSSRQLSVDEVPVDGQAHRELFFFGGTIDDSVFDVAVNGGVFTTLVALLEQVELDDVLDRQFGFWFWKKYFTVFAPTDAAFEKLPDATVTSLTTNPEFESHLRGVLLYHVAFPFAIFSENLSDGKNLYTLLGHSPLEVNITDGVITVNDATIDDELFDLEADNGVVHVIDTVLLPPFMERTIVDVAIEYDDFFSELVRAVVAADLVDTLSAAGPFTLFAPTNNAFDKLPEGTLDDLIDAEDKTPLINILLYHVVPDTIILRKEIEEDVTVTTALTDATAEVTLTSGSWFRRKGVQINDANVFFFDILANNGVVHVIDEVLMPPASDP